MLFFLDYLQSYQKCVSLHCVFHSIRFKVNKGWSKALLLFLCPYARYSISFLFIFTRSNPIIALKYTIKVRYIIKSDSITDLRNRHLLFLLQKLACQFYSIFIQIGNKRLPGSLLEENTKRSPTHSYMSSHIIKSYIPLCITNNVCLNLLYPFFLFINFLLLANNLYAPTLSNQEN